MATLADSFLADLNQLSDDEESDLIEEGGVVTDMDEDVNSAEIKALKLDDLDSISKLQKTPRYNDVMQRVEEALERGPQTMEKDDDDGNPEYKLIADCNQLCADIDNEIAIIHNFIRDKYRFKFPELHKCLKVNRPIDYARVVKRIGNEMDLTLIHLDDLLPSDVIMTVSMTAVTTIGKPLPDDVLRKTIDACDRTLALDSAKKKVLDFLESRMGFIAPNLSAIVGSAVAAKIIVTPRGLAPTSQIRSCYIEQTEIYQTSPPSLRKRVYKLLVLKSALAASIDLSHPSGDEDGRSLRQKILKTIHNWQDLPPARHPKPLPVPDSKPKKKRGGRRHRKTKERDEMTDIRKLTNRIQFGIPEETSLGDGLGQGYGMLGQAGSGKLRLAAARQTKLGAKKNGKKFKNTKQYGSCGATSGLTSSLAFTTMQGIELTNPQAHAHQLGGGTKSTYFSEMGTFSKIKRT